MEFDLPESRMPVGFNQDDFAFSKLYKCVHEEGQTTMCDVVRAMYAHPLVKSEGGTMFLRDYFKQVLGWKSAKIKSTIGKMEQPLLTVDIMTQELDISFAYKVMVEVCCSIYNELSDDCRCQIDFLKKMRNKVNHKYGCRGLNVASEIDTLKVVLREIYEGVGTVLKMDFADKISAMEKRLSDICDAQVRQKDIISYEEDVQSFKRDKLHKLISNGRKELKEEYRKLRVLNPCTWMLDEEVKRSSVDKFCVDKIFTPLKTEDSREEIEMENLLTVTKQISGEQKLPSALLLHGLAGSGKTSLCHYLLHEWYSEEKEDSALNNFDLVLFVSVRTVRSCSLKEYLMQQLIFKTTKDFKPDNVITLLKELDVLFIIDGFDEANDMSCDLVEEIFAKFGDHRIILTTRPEFQRDAALLSRKHHVEYLTIEICGFDDQRLEEFTEKVFKAVEENPKKCKKQTSSFLKYIRGRGKVLGSHLKLPLTLALLIYLWRDDPDILNQVTTSTCLYFELFKLCQKKMQERLKLVHQDSRIIEDLLLFLGGQAWCMLQSGNISISDDIKDNIEKKCIDVGIDETQFMSAFLMCEFSESEDICGKNFSFLHKTQMEYLAAAFLANVVREKKDFNWIKEVVKEWRRYHEVIIFLTGHLAKELILSNYISDLFQLVDKAEVDSLNFNFWWKLFVESFQHCQFGKIIAEAKLPIEDWELNDTHLVAGLKLLIYTKIKLKTLKIEIASSVEPYAVPDFLDIMKEMRGKLKHRYHNHNPILVQIHFWRHNEYNFDKPTDEFLRTLHPWGHLENFTGGLGEQEEGKEVLSYCFKLKTIRARVMTPGALKSLSNSLLKIHKTVRQLRITLALPMDCEPTSLAALTFRGNLEITMQSIRDENKEWFVEVIRQVSGGKGCQHIFLQKSEVSFSGILWLVENMRGVFQGKFSIETVNEPNREEKTILEKKERSTYIAINWI